MADRSGEVVVVPTGSTTAGCGSRSSTTARGLPPDFDWRQSRSLGLSIVNTLVAEMEGRFALGRAIPTDPGTRAIIEIPLG